MKTATTMQRIITALAERHGIDLTNPNAFLWLSIPQRAERLVIERIDEWRLSIGFTREDGDGDYLLAPEVLFFTDVNGWLPLRAFPAFSERGMTGLVEDLASLLRTEGWVEHSQKLADPPWRMAQAAPWEQPVCSDDGEPVLPDEEDLCDLPY
ncbi:MAG: hypothetical protein U0350_48770 [Caldilineaceae bacterium]